MPLTQSVTERGSFRSCRRQWYWDAIMRYERKDAFVWYFWFGDLIHESLAHYYSNDRDMVSALELFEESWRLTKDDFAVNNPFMFEQMEQEFWDYRNLGMNMLKNYEPYDKMQTDFDDVLEVNIEERHFVRFAPHWHLAAKIDVVVVKAGKLFIWDHKTASEKPDIGLLDVDDQLTGYMYVLWRLLQDSEFIAELKAKKSPLYEFRGCKPDGAVYNVLFKWPIHEPKILKSGLLSCDKQQRTTYALYLKKLKELGHDPSNSYYAEILAALKAQGWSRFYTRDNGVVRSLTELHNFERNMMLEFEDMEACLDDPKRLYPNPSQWNCRGCKFLEPCRLSMEGNDVEWALENKYRIKEPRYFGQGLTVVEEVK